MRFSIQINKFLVFIFGLLLISCQPQSERKKPVQIKSIQLTEDTVKFINKDTVNELKQELTEVINDSDFVFLDEIDTTFCYDLKYATADNFLNERVYECANCILRYESVLALQKANTIFKTQGYRIQFFDCYRPVEVQKKMWEIMPDGRYVANPYKSGSIHN
jgi:D-alanyl-D-alanine dipeptidase